MNFDYNTQRRKLRLPEYGRHIQKMIQYVKTIEDREERNRQMMAVIAVMGNLNPHLRDIVDFRHKLWDHAYLIADFDIDIDSPYPTPAPETFDEKPQSIPYPRSPLLVMHYGRHMENILNTLADRPESDEKQAMIIAAAQYMKKQYVLWNKDTVTDEIIFRDIERLSNGRITVNPALKLPNVQAEPVRPHSQNNNMKNKNSGRNKIFKKNKGGRP
ncbi:MAG: DUF4290 domain-containing protein [Prevotellaceae bacterium]|jgi:hypothetical protein|nr:DUF4290 domain-containing protein [Prevotellaceae bacterium]